MATIGRYVSRALLDRAMSFVDRSEPRRLTSTRSALTPAARSRAASAVSSRATDPGSIATAQREAGRALVTTGEEAPARARPVREATPTTAVRAATSGNRRAALHMRILPRTARRHEWKPTAASEGRECTSVVGWIGWLVPAAFSRRCQRSGRR